MIWLKRITEKYNKKVNIRFLTNLCFNSGCENGTPCVGSVYCEEKCSYYKGQFKIGKFKFVKCSKFFN